MTFCIEATSGTKILTVTLLKKGAVGLLVIRKLWVVI